MIEVISIHIPKTAGRSLLHVLKQVYGDEQVLVVNRDLFRADRDKALNEIRNSITPYIKVIHGHVYASEIKEIIEENPQAKLITFLRSPVDRVVSHYFYEQKILKEKGHISGFKNVPVDSIIPYASHPESVNLISKFLEGVPLNRFYFAGRFENFSQDVKNLGKMLNWPPFAIPFENKNEVVNEINKVVNAGDLDAIGVLNQADLDLYSRLQNNNRFSKKHSIKCWIASFPRSGNTFFRNILYYVYGIESSEWHKETAYNVALDYDQFAIVKTHLLPHELEPNDPSIPAIYLVRDGRDAVVSIAHHRSDLVMPGSDFNQNMNEAIVAAGGSFFGGWSKNATAWLNRAQLVIRYEDLVTDPRKVFARIEKLIDLPSPNWDNLPTFEQMKSGKPEYGGTTKLISPKFNTAEFSQKFFRKGKAGGWKDEMPEEMQDLFWNYHGDTMERFGYETHKGSVEQNTFLDYRAMKLLGKDVEVQDEKKFHVLIEASKLTQPGNDGIKRYLVHLLKGFEEVTVNGDPRWSFELLIGRKFLPLGSYRQMLRIEADELHDYEKMLMGFKKLVHSILPDVVYRTGSEFYKKTNARTFLKQLQKKKSITKELEFYRELELKKEDIDLLHIPLPQNSEHLQSLTHNFVITVHDMTHRLFSQYHEDANIRLAEAGMKFIADKKADVIAVSKNTIHDIKMVEKISEEKIHLVYESPDKDLFKWNTNHNLAGKIRLKYKLTQAPYFLCLSTIEPRKNLPNTIKAFNLFKEENPGSEVNLVISGSFGWKTGHLSKELHLDNPHIIFTGYVEDSDLSVIYSEAIALCYVSFYEGFGLPPLEAMSCRTPVIYGNNSSMVEVIGDAGLAADAENPNSIKNQMQKMFFDITLREELAKRSHRRSFGFSWRKSIYDTLKVYEKIISASRVQKDIVS